MYFTDNDGYHNFLVFPPMLSSVILDSNKKFTKYQLDTTVLGLTKLFEFKSEIVIGWLRKNETIVNLDKFQAIAIGKWKREHTNERISV